MLITSRSNEINSKIHPCKMMAKGSKIKFLLFILGMLLLIAIIPKSVQDKNVSLGVSEESSNIKKNGLTILTSTVYIDDTIPSKNWSKTTADNPWCTGSGTSSDPYVISDVEIDAHGVGSCIYIKNSAVYFIIESCTVYNSQDSDLGHAGIRLEYTTNGEILNCIIRDNHGDGIALEGCSDIKIQGCSFSNNIFGVAHKWSTHSLMIIKNTFSHNERGVFMSAEGRNDQILENVFISNLEGNVYLNPGISNVIKDNKITGGFRGIYLLGENNLVSSNDISSCSQGIVLINGYHNEDNVITTNSIHDNSYGIMVEGSSCQHNLFYNNSFTGNVYNAQDDGHDNDWNNEIIGNYWDDYTGLDANDDGIGDYPYIVNGLANSRDNIPIYWDGPKITVIIPHQNAVFETAPNFEIMIEDGIVDTTWYTLNNEKTKIFITNYTGIIDETEWNKLPNGTMSINFYAKDFKNYISCAGITIHKDVLAPIVTVVYPRPNYRYGFNAPNYYLSIIEYRLSSIWYSFDYGITIFPLHFRCGTLNQAIWETIESGNVTIRFYAVDSFGHESFIDVNVIKLKSVPIIPGPNLLFIILMILSSIIYIIWYNKKKFGKFISD